MIFLIHETVVRKQRARTGGEPTSCITLKVRWETWRQYSHCTCVESVDSPWHNWWQWVVMWTVLYIFSVTGEHRQPSLHTSLMSFEGWVFRVSIENWVFSSSIECWVFRASIECWVLSAEYLELVLCVEYWALRAECWELMTIKVKKKIYCIESVYRDLTSWPLYKKLPALLADGVHWTFRLWRLDDCRIECLSRPIRWRAQTTEFARNLTSEVHRAFVFRFRDQNLANSEVSRRLSWEKKNICLDIFLNWILYHCCSARCWSQDPAHTTGK